MNTKELITLAALGGVAYLVWRSMQRAPTPTEAAMWGFGNSSLNRPVTGFFNWYLNQGYDPLSAQEAAEVSAVADQLNADLGWSPTRGGIW